MQLRLPNLVADSCSMFWTCGKVKTEDKTLLKRLAEHPEWMVAHTKVANRTFYLRAHFGGKHGKHCHIELATADFFPKGKQPKGTHTKADIQEVLALLKDEKIDVELEGAFSLPTLKLPPVITLTADVLKSKQDGVSIRMASGKIHITGTPVYAITWFLGNDEDKDDDGNSLIRLEARVETTINDAYIVDLFSMLKSAFQSFVKSGVPNAR